MENKINWDEVSVGQKIYKHYSGYGPSVTERHFLKAY